MATVQVNGPSRTGKCEVCTKETDVCHVTVHDVTRLLCDGCAKDAVDEFIGELIEPDGSDVSIGQASLDDA